MEKVVAKAGPFGGLNFSAPPFALGLSAPEVSRNVIRDRDGSLRLRPAMRRPAGAEFTAAIPNWASYFTMVAVPGAEQGVTVIRGGSSHIAVTRRSNAHRMETDLSFTNYFFDPDMTVLIGSTLYLTTNASVGLPSLHSYNTIAGTATAPVAGVMTTGEAPRGLLATPWDERLLMIGASSHAGGSYPRRVAFSEPGDPTNWPTTNYEEFTAGGTALRGGGTYRDLCFVWSRHEAWVIYGTGTNAVGGPELQYRRVGFDATVIYKGVVGPDGIYLLTDRGLLRSQGGDFRLVGGELGGLFGRGGPMDASGLSGTTATEFGDLADPYDTQLVSAGDLIAVALPQSGGVVPGVLVYDTQTRTWSLWKGPWKAFGSMYSDVPYSAPVLGAIGTDLLVYSLDSQGGDTGVDALAGTTGLASAFWRSGPVEGAGLTQEWTARELQILGSGPITARLVADDTVLGATAAATMGAAGADGVAYHRVAQKGQRIAVELSGFSAATTVRRLALLGDQARDPTLRAKASG